MTSQSPRVYVYKITFEEVPHYYYGSHKEKRFDEYYMGSPSSKRNKWYWKTYTPKKEILQVFDFSDEGRIEASKFENDLIRPVYNSDPLCLNENCGGLISLESCREGGKIAGKLSYESRTGIHGLTQEQRTEVARMGGKVGGQRLYELGLGIHGRTKEQRSEDAKKGGKKGGKVAGKLAYELGLGIHGLSQEQKIEIARKGGRAAAEVIRYQKWQCTVTGFISSPGGLSKYQKNRGIDTLNRIRLK